MGSQRYEIRQAGATVEEALADAQAEAEDEYGHQEGYSGQINMACGINDVTEEYAKSKLDMEDFVEMVYDRTSKHSPCQAICLIKPVENKNQIKTQVKHHVTKGTKKWVLKYAIYSDWPEDKHLGNENSKGEAVKQAREYTSKHKTGTCVKMERVLEKHKEAEVASITYKKSSTESDGEWLLFGHASD